MDVIQQIQTVNPSVKGALFRRLLREPELAYLRQDGRILGFRVLPQSPLLTGFALIGMRKHTILAYRSEEVPPRLILFPTLAKLTDANYGLMKLMVEQVQITDDSFYGPVMCTGTLQSLVQSFLPQKEPEPLVVSQTPDQMVHIMNARENDQQAGEAQAAQGALDAYRSPGPSTDPVSAPAPAPAPAPEPEVKLSPDQMLMAQTFDSEQALINYTVHHFGVKQEILKALLNALLGQLHSTDPHHRIYQFQLLVAKLLQQKPEVITRHD